MGRQSDLDRNPRHVVSTKLARILGNPWCERILMEMASRSEMSASQFVKEVGGDLATIARCFVRLANEDLIEFVAFAPSGAKLFRLVHRAHIDTATWEGLSDADRRGFSGSILDSYTARIGEAVISGTFDAELDRHLSWTPVSLDGVGLSQLNDVLDGVLDSLPVLEAESSRRLAVSEAAAIPITLGLASFRIPEIPDEDRRLLRPLADRHVPTNARPDAMDMRVLTAAASKWRSRILMEISTRPLSPSRFCRDVGGSMSNISRCFNQLAEWRLIELAEKRTGGRRRGSVEKMYRQLASAHLSTKTWERLPWQIRSKFSESILDSYLARFAEAFDAGTFDQDADRHFSWAPANLDRSAWKTLVRRLDEVLDLLPGLEREALSRIADGSRIPVIVGLSAFRSPGRKMERA